MKTCIRTVTVALGQVELEEVTVRNSISRNSSTITVTRSSSTSIVAVLAVIIGAVLDNVVLLVYS